jgi:hypothetical protein
MQAENEPTFLRGYIWGRDRQAQKRSKTPRDSLGLSWRTRDSEIEIGSDLDSGKAGVIWYAVTAAS